MVVSAPFDRLDEVVSMWAHKRPRACAASLGAENISYDEMNRSVQRLANALLAAGIERGDRVAVLQTPRPEFLVTLLAVSSLGAIWVGLNPKYQKAELLNIIADCQPRILITRTRVSGRDYSEEIAALRSDNSLER